MLRVGGGVSGRRGLVMIGVMVSAAGGVIGMIMTGIRDTSS